MPDAQKHVALPCYTARMYVVEGWSLTIEPARNPV